MLSYLNIAHVFSMTLHFLLNRNCNELVILSLPRISFMIFPPVSVVLDTTELLGVVRVGRASGPFAGVVEVIGSIGVATVAGFGFGFDNNERLGLNFDFRLS